MIEIKVSGLFLYNQNESAAMNVVNLDRIIVLEVFS